MAARLLFDLNFGRRHKKQRVYRHFSHNFDEAEYKERYRFSMESVRFITDLIEPELCRPTMRSHSLSAINQVEIALRYFATGDNMKTVGDTLGFHKSSVSRSVRDVSQALTDVSPKFIKWPSTTREKMAIKKRFYGISGFPAVIGAVDGTHVRIIAPSEHESVYVNRKGFHSINTQAICDHEGRFTNIVAKWPGSNHDSFIFRGSNVGIDLEVHHRGIDVDGVLLGDSGYACGRYLVTPFLRPVNQAQQNYNAAHTRTRAVIERCFGWWKRRFMVLHGEIKCKPERVSKIIVACAVLHNIALDRKETMAEDDNGIACDEEDLGGVAVQPRNDNIRQFIVDNYF
ncbi:putative nuclease HARBI1 [Crassostrea angulata]|uniref:putative nuclease HARBI1 n=1 Tax=Magallana angulata TaxID=2784310 RepID=UPI0022B1BF81|nr:putative nuclease HARBI1 [Crassostrea angulata]